MTGQALDQNLPELRKIRYKPTVQPQIRQFDEIPTACLDCGGTRTFGPEFARARLDPENRNGGEGYDLYSGNVDWRKELFNLPGRAGLNLRLQLVYNSLVWTNANGMLAFDADRGYPGPGFTLGFAKLQGPFINADGLKSYLLIDSDGSHSALAQTRPQHYEAIDGTLFSFDELNSGGGVLLRANGDRLMLAPINGQLVCTRVIDRNGNYLTVNYDSSGRLQQISDTATRTIHFVYGSSGNLELISETAGGAQRILVSFGYSEVPVNPPIPGMAVIGATGLSPVPALSDLGLPDGSSYHFEYTTFGQVSKIARLGPDKHMLSYIAYDYSVIGGSPQVRTVRTWAQSLNNESENRTDIYVDRTAGQSSAQASDGSRVTEVFGSTGWQKGLSLRRVEQNSDGNLRIVETTWQQIDLGNAAFRYLRQSRTETNTDSSGVNSKLITTFDSLGFPIQSDEYSGPRLIKQLHIEYSNNVAFVTNHVMGLVSRAELTDAAGNLSSSVELHYDESGSLSEQQGLAQHDDVNYGTSLGQGRGLVTSILRTNSKTGLSSSIHFRYNTAGLRLGSNDSSGYSTRVDYTDNYSTQASIQTMVFATSTLANGKTTNSVYDLATGKRLRLQSSDGEVHTFNYDSAGRVIGQNNLTTGTTARRVFDETGTLVATFSKRRGASRELGYYKVLDGTGLVRARAEDPTTPQSGYQGIVVWRDTRGRIIAETSRVKMSSNWVALESSQASSSSQAVKVASLLWDRTVSAIQPTVFACDSDYYGGCDDPYDND